MRVRVDTASGSSYGLNNKEMTWVRVNPSVPDILNLEGVNKGNLLVWPILDIGDRMTFIDAQHGLIRTTPIIRIELTSEVGE